MIQIGPLRLPPGHSDAQLRAAAARLLGIRAEKIRRIKLLKRSIDARKKPQVFLSYHLAIDAGAAEPALLARCKAAKPYAPYVYHIPAAAPNLPRPVVVGFGPAGMFAALVLALAGCRPIVLERGQDAQTRQKAVQAFWNGGALEPENNVQFGEGGAGTFSDGKLTTGTHNPRIGWILSQLVQFGAEEQILYDARPHVGTDALVRIVGRLRAQIIRLGGEVRFGAKVTGIETQGGCLTALRCNEIERIACRSAIFAIGHSARDTIRMLYGQGVPMEPKPFSMGVRIEHPQPLIDEAQYGFVPHDRQLPPAIYKLACHLPSGDGVYTFCMCPGGYVVAAASEPGGVVTNGMSYSGRGGRNANSALLVSLQPQQFPIPGALGGIEWQQTLERRAFECGGRNYFAPAQLVSDFLAGRPSRTLGSVAPSYRPGVTLCDLHEVLPPVITRPLAEAITALDRKLRGFALPDAVLTAPETRSSCPVRILRGDDLQSRLRGLYPCGEGAGYAGGIISSAVDGMLCAEAILQAQKQS